ncbi:hypothetical protein BB934_13940 [Microvirga ossetica]|uniref:Uncharacterized protein n=1 Tax=Microvirga ossetica TaxID=1882682 RepID=A0A1B2EGT0_9HYPH|nr:hypothetical protein BB934_13940 [Microvirga ossetica]
MNYRSYHETIRRLDPDGRTVVGVILNNASRICWLFEEDYKAIVAKHGLCSWFLNSNGKGKSYVRLKGKHENLVQVSRLILGDSLKGNVTYLDKDHLNLRTTNLHVQGKSSKQKPKSKPLAKPLGSGLRIPMGSVNG